MKLVKLGVLTAFAGLAFVACSGDTKHEKGTAKAEFNLLTPEGVELTEVTYDLDEQDGTQVKTGVIPVPNDDSVINGFIGALPLGEFELGLSATGTYLGEPVSCATAAPSPFTIDEDGETVTISPNPVLVCQVEVEIGQEIGNVIFNVDVQVDAIETIVNALETFTVAPTTAAVTNSGGTCTWAPIGIDVDDPASGVTIEWTASPDGTFTLDADNTDGTYNCSNPGSKTLTVTATLGGASASVNVPVTCNDDACGVTGPVCGNGSHEPPTEDCDDGLEGCVDCQVACGDGLRYVAIEGCDDGNVNDGDGCSSTCQVEPCEMGEIDCAGTCVDPLGDESNCGACGTVCASGESCEAGVCTPGCSDTVCGGACVDTDTDVNNCGACGNVCASGESCEAGVCTAPGGGLAECLTCIDTMSGAAGFNEAVCNPDSLCTAVRDCALDNAAGNACYTPIPAECYCGDGADLVACETDPNFVEQGACWEEIVAGLPAGLTNAEILQQIYAYDQPTGRAMLIVEEARSACSSVCGL